MAKLAVFFPGIGYHCDKPLLYYGRDIAYEKGYENYRNLTYSFEGGNIRGKKEKMEEAFYALFSQTESLLSDVNWKDYEDILFISKSIGTIIATAYAKKYDLQGVRHVLYTPLEQTFDYVEGHAVGFVGTNDPWSDVDEIIKLAKTKNVILHVYEGLNHSLEREDTMKNLETLMDVMNKTREYL